MCRAALPPTLLWSLSKFREKGSTEKWCLAVTIWSVQMTKGGRDQLGSTKDLLFGRKCKVYQLKSSKMFSSLTSDCLVGISAQAFSVKYCMSLKVLEHHGSLTSAALQLFREHNKEHSWTKALATVCQKLHRGDSIHGSTSSVTENNMMRGF